MDVKPGYKMTEVGVIPEDWELRPMLSVVQVAHGQVDPRVEPYRSMILVAPDHIESSSGRLLKKETAGVQRAFSGKYVFSVNDVVYSKIRPYLRKAILADFEGLCSADMYPLKPAGDVSSGFVFAVILGHHFSKYAESVSVRSGMPKINRLELADYVMALPPTNAEQTAIAEALSNADSLIASLQKLIAKKKAIKQGAMQELLTGKKRLPGFSGKWIHKSFEELFYINGGLSASREQLSTKGYCYLHYGDIHGSLKQYVDVSSEFLQLPRLSIPLGKISATSLLRDGDIVFVDASEDDEGTGKHIVIRNKKKIPYIAGLHTLICNPKNDDLNNLFKEYCFCSRMVRQQIIFYAVGTKVTGISKSNIAKIILHFPINKTEQSAIAQVLSDMDAEIEQLEKKLSKYQLIKQGMMQELLTGRIRLIDAAAAAAEQAQPVTKIIPFTVTPKQKQPAPTKTHSQQFDDAVMISGIVDAFYSEKYPLGRKKVQKLLYLMRRWEEADISAFQKKAAGPYADSIRYKGGEPIAKKNGYISVDTSKKGSQFVRGKNIAQALEYIQVWERQGSIDWLVTNFQYTKVDGLELLATIDMAACDLRELGTSVSVQTVKELIKSTKEWREKLAKTYFSDQDIHRALNMCQELFGDQ